MNSAALETDVQDRGDTRGVFLDKAGIKGLKIPLVVHDKANGKQHVAASVNVYSSLSEKKKGVHLSGFMDTINEFSEKTLSFETIEGILKKLKQGEMASIEIEFTYFILKESPVSRLKSHMNYECKIIGNIKDKGTDIRLQAKVPVMTLCPDGKVLTGCASHSQRGVVTVTAKGGVWFEDLIKHAESSGTEIFQVLKKEDDRHVMEKAYHNPQFVEDLIRDVVVSLRKDERIGDFSVSVENSESNHNYNAYAEVENVQGI